MSELFLDSLKLLLSIPQSYTSISWGCNEFVCIDGMKFTIIDGIGMAFGLFLLFHPHVTFDSE